MADHHHHPQPPARVRVEFEDRHLLSTGQRSDGLRRCWLLLRPQFSTVADVAVHLAASFNLSRSCPDGIVLFMDEYVLPPFESVSIFRDDDVVRIRKKIVKQKTLEYETDNNQRSAVLKKRSHLVSNTRLAIEDSHYDLVDYGGTNVEEICEAEASLKRKRELSNKPKEKKRKRLNINNHEEPTIKTAEEKEKANLDHNENLHSKTNCRRDISGGSENFDAHNVSSVDVKKKNFMGKSWNGDDKEECCAVYGKLEVSGRTEKLPSRCARRKKAKKLFWRKITEQQIDQRSKEETDDIEGARLDQNVVDRRTNACSEEYEKPKNIAEEEQPNNHTVEGIDTEVVPIVVRPGHVRFESIDEELDRSRCNGQMEIVQWNGFTNKKKGQKWVRENTSKRNGEKNCIKACNVNFGTEGKNVDENNIKFGSLSPLTHPQNEIVDWNGVTNKKGQNWSREKTSISNNEDFCDRATNVKVNTKEGDNVNENNINFESLPPLTRPPKKDDILVYRVVELSSSWCPELSSFRVGRVSSYDNMSLKIIFLPVLEYPTFIDDKNDAEEPNIPSTYLEDGSLEIEYSSLLDVRLLMACESETTITGGLEKGQTEKSTTSNNVEMALVTYHSNNSITTVAEKSPNSGWEQSNQALNEKKAELNKDGWGTWTRNDNAFVPWPYRGPRRHNLSFSPAFLRGISVSGRKSTGRGKSMKPR